MKANDEQILEALREAKGMITHAARKLGISRLAIYKRLEKSKKLREAFEEIKEANIDNSEIALLKNIDDGDTTAIIFHLKCLGKKRGYTEKQEIDITTGGDKINTIKLIEVVKEQWLN